MKGNLHSWSVSTYWSGGAYTSDHKYPEIMWNKPGELTDFTGNGYENAYYWGLSISLCKHVTLRWQFWNEA
jgi:hypothetical protein